MKAEAVEGPQALQDHTRQDTDAYLQRPCCGAQWSGHPKEGLWDSHKVPNPPAEPQYQEPEPHPGRKRWGVHRKYAPSQFIGAQQHSLSRKGWSCPARRAECPYHEALQSLPGPQAPCSKVLGVTNTETLGLEELYPDTRA